MLDKKGEDWNAYDLLGDTALIYLLDEMELGAINLLIKKGMDINHPNARGETPLLLCVKKDQWSRMNFLIKKGADIYVKSPEGKSLWVVAIHEMLNNNNFNSPDILNLLWKHLPFSSVTVSEREEIMAEINAAQNDPVRYREFSSEAIAQIEKFQGEQLALLDQNILNHETPMLLKTKSMGRI